MKTVRFHKIPFYYTIFRELIRYYTIFWKRKFGKKLALFLEARHDIISASEKVLNWGLSPHEDQTAEMVLI